MILFAFKEMHFGGGAEKNLIEVALHMAKRHRVGFYFAGGYIDPRVAGAGPVFLMPGKGRFWAAPLDLLHLAWVVIRHRVRLMHAHHRYPAFLANLLRKLLRFKLITTVHNRFPNRAKASLWGDKAIAVSHDIAQWLRDECGTPESLIAVIHNGIAAPPAHSPDEIANLRRQSGLSEVEVLLVAVGRLSEQKNFGLLLTALSQLRQERWALLLVGEGELHADLTAQTALLGLSERVRFLGRRSDVPLIMQSSDALVMSSSWEGFPYVIVEALANGLPIVATDVGGVREGVLHDETGLLVPPADADALTEALGRIIESRELRLRLGRSGSALFHHRFLDTAMLLALDQEYRRLGVD